MNPNDFSDTLTEEFQQHRDGLGPDSQQISLPLKKTFPLHHQIENTSCPIFCIVTNLENK